jgi:ABC-2 type transport system permease protein
MYRALLVAQREFLENIRTKGFWLSILMMPIMLVIIGIVPVLVSSTRTAQSFTVIDESGWLLNKIQYELSLSDAIDYLKAPVEEDRRTPLDEIKPTLATLEDPALTDVARQLVNQTAELQDSLPEEVRNFFRTHRGDISRWWQGLSATDRAELSPRISTNFFRFEEAEGRSPDSLNQAVQDNELFAYFVIGPSPKENSDDFRFVSNNLTDRELLNWFNRSVTKVVRSERLSAENIDPGIANWINTPPDFESRQIGASGEEESVESTDVVRQWAPVVFVYLLWISVLINTQMLLTNTIEEKSNKLIEVLLSSISPIVLMGGKILGIALTGLTIIGSWMLMAIAFFFLLPQLPGIELPFDITSVAIDPWFLGSFFVYFLLGYLLYAAILVGLGSVCNNLKEAQNLMLPVQLVQMMPILLMVPIGRDPNGTLAQILSYVPPLTPFVMMNRAAGPPSGFEYVTTTLLLIVSIIAALWFAAKIFRIGILLTGKPPGFLQILRWLRTPVTDAARLTMQTPSTIAVPTLEPSDSNKP